MKSQSYMTRALTARDPRFARVLGKLGYQKDDQHSAESSSQSSAEDEDRPTTVSKKPRRVENLASLRERYKEAVGKRAFHGWGADDLRRKIAAASKSR